MVTSTLFQRLGIASGIALLAFICWWLFFRSTAVEAPVVLEPYIDALTLSRRGDDDKSTEDDSQIDDVIELPVNTGFYLELTFTPGATLPKQLDKLKMQPAEKWPFGMEIYAASDVKRKESIKLPFFWSKRVEPRFKSISISTPFRKIPLANTRYWQKDVGYSGVPNKQEDWNESDVRLWSYITPGSHGPGEYAYEIVTYPVAQWLSSVRAVKGPAIVVQRGKFIVREE